MGDSCCGKPVRCHVPVTLILLIIYFCYLLLGATVFWALEREAEQNLTLSFQQDKWELLRNHTCMDNKTLELFIKGIIDAYKKGVTLLGNNTSQETWDFSGSFFFSVTAITTIGYGNLSPTTTGGRIFCVFFALFGIPLNLVLLNRIGQKMLFLVQKCGTFLGTKIQHKKAVKLFSSSCALIVGLLFFFLLPPLLFQRMEGWSYEEGFYFAFITLSTIGFGDYIIGRIPDTKYPGWYKNMVALWILFGMAWLALIINLCITLLENTKEACFCCTNRQDSVDQELIRITQNEDVPSKQKEVEDYESFTSNDTKPKSPD
ncbi:potassium channel subfamily K member 17 [Hyperolius riggenbachi]|uniref:potassium channel subfamily K member 17 n=1 Tax=Hyperolius riggenbachi TaxID=752182 RepID=UPI0035A2B580